jgi:hypothetical protein
MGPTVDGMVRIRARRQQATESTASEPEKVPVTRT